MFLNILLLCGSVYFYGPPVSPLCNGALDMRRKVSRYLGRAAYTPSVAVFVPSGPLTALINQIRAMRAVGCVKSKATSAVIRLDRLPYLRDAATGRLLSLSCHFLRSCPALRFADSRVSRQPLFVTQSHTLVLP